MSIYSPFFKRWFALASYPDYQGGRGKVITYYVREHPQYAYTEEQVNAMIRAGVVRKDIKQAA